MSESVDILMATHNGMAYLKQQIESIQAQSYTNWRLLVRDDGSTDETISILERIAAQDNRIQLVDDELGNLGVIANFGRLLELSEANYVFLCDQDDVWFPDKLSAFVDCASELDAVKSTNEPRLMFSDLTLVDGNLAVLAPSYMQMQQRADCLNVGFRNLLTQNVMPGCAMMVNRALLERALPISSGAAMHDWWLILVAACCGTVHYLDKPLAAYRQHSSNVMGAVKPSIKSLLGKGLSKYKRRLRAGERQAQVFVQRFHDQMAPDDLSAANCLAALPSQGFLAKRISAYRHGLRKDGMLRNAVFYALM